MTVRTIASQATPLHLAVKEQNEVAFRLLIELGADIDAQNGVRILYESS